MSRYLPKTTFGSVEYPGPVSHHAKLLDVVHQQDVDECFNALGSEQPVLEMAFGRGVPVKGHRVGAAKVLVKIRKRRRDGGGAFVAEVVGTIPHSVRFRCE
jgi:general transcription factor 3C polypeptide 5 (transcription factor C subunit 1)